MPRFKLSPEERVKHRRAADARCRAKHLEARREKDRERYWKDPEKRRSNVKKWRQKNPIRKNTTALLWARKNPVAVLIGAAKARAKKKNVPFDLLPEDIRIPENCPVFGIPLLRGEGIAEDQSPSLDRMVPEKGYVKGNIWVISHRANRIKNNATLAELKQLTAALEAQCSAGH